jgi:pimeloyl-ACP methyl ester carboxylesterase
VVTETAVTEHVVRDGSHRTFYLAAGPEDGPPIIFVHGWPELAISWRHQLPCSAALGFRALAPDMRGYGRSSVYARHEDYALERVVGDMIGLLDALGVERAVWVGHDWGAAVVWSLASHYPERCHAVANLCVPYYSLERGLDSCLPQIDRNLYPEDEFSAGQWEYMRFYEENFATAIAPFDAAPAKAIKALFRRGNPAAMAKPSRTAFVRRDGGWFGGAAKPPDVPRDDAVLSEVDLCAYAAALGRNGFFGPGSYYMNHTANAAYAERAANGGILEMPTLFVAGEYDATCECMTSRLAEPMRDTCRKLTTRVVASGHWMAQEKPAEVNATLAAWLATSVANAWPAGGMRQWRA